MGGSIGGGDLTNIGLGEFIPNPGGPNCHSPNPLECCKEFGGIDYMWCVTFCVFCCMECDLGQFKRGALTLPAALDRPAIRDFDSFNVVNGEIGFTTSEYGKFIPIVFGSDRLTGNVFWSSGFETKQLTQGDTTYTYSTVSFALGICEGEIDAVLRMWLGETVILDKTADVDEDGIAQPNDDGFVLGFMVDLISADSPLKDLADGSRLTKISVFNGSETQLPEGVIVEKEGFSLTPAYRGLAYVLFENMVVTEVIPNIFVEVLANVNAVFPRLYGNLPTPQTLFDELGDDLLFYEPSYDQIIVQAIDDSGTGDVPNGAGYAVFDGNRLDPLFQHEIEITEGVDDFTSLDPSQFHILSDGRWLIRSNAGFLGAGTLFTYDPTSGTRLDTLGPAGDVLNNDFPNGFGSMGLASGTLFYPVSGPPVDIFYGVNSEDGHVGYALIDGSGQIEMVSSQDDVLPNSSGRGASATMVFSDAFIAANPEFQDGAETGGAHIYFVTQAAALTGLMSVTRGTIAGAATVYDPLYTACGDISFNEFNGAEYQHIIDKVMVDGADGCLVVFLRANRGDYVCKWSPFIHEIVWKAPVPGGLMGHNHAQGVSDTLLWGQVMWWIGADQRLAYLDLATGIIEDKGSLDDQLLPDAKQEQQYYNGFENSLVYMASEGSNQLIKVFLDRIARANVLLSSIVTTLLQRVGVLETEIDIEDIQALLLVGYTVTEKKTLRAIFSELGQVFRFDIVESNGHIIYKTRGGAPVATVSKADLADVDDNGFLLQHQEKDFVPTRKINLTYRDIDREYGTNVQSLILPKYSSSRFDEDAAVDVNVPVVLTADDAKALAEILLYSKIIYQSTYEAVLAPRHMVYDPGDVLTLDLEDREVTVRVRDMSIGNDKEVKVSLSQEDPDIYNDQAALFGVVGRFARNTLPVLEPRIDPVILDMPFRSDAEAALTTSSYLIYLTFLNQRTFIPPERNVTLTINGEVQSVPMPIHYPTWGRVMTAPVARSSYFSTDYVSQLRIKLISDSGALLASAASKLALLNSSQMNLAFVGGELIQFETVVDEGNDVYLLTGLHRGRFGTEPRSINHKAGESFVLLGNDEGELDEIAIVRLTVPIGESPFKMYQVFMNSNNPFQPSPIKFVPALNLRPWAPASFKGEYVGDDLELTWQRRTRYDGQWLDDGDFEIVPLNELTETYDVYLFSDPPTFNFSDASTYLRKLTLPTSSYTYTDAEQTEDGFDRTSEDVFVLINQNGSYTGKDAGTARTHRVEYQR